MDDDELELVVEHETITASNNPSGTKLPERVARIETEGCM